MSRSELVISSLFTYPAIQPYEKLIDSAGKITILGSGKATTRAEGRITAALRVLGLCTAIPTRAFRKTECRSLETRGSVKFVPNKPEVVKFFRACPIRRVT